MAPMLFVALVLVSTSGCTDRFEGSPLADLNLAFNLPAATTPGTTASAQAPVFSVESLFEKIPGRRGHHAATITAFRDGELLAAWYSYPGEEELAGSAIYMARRPAGSERWDIPRLHIDRDVGDGNPVLYSEGNTVWFFQAVVPFGWSTSHIELQLSPDRGAHWTEPVVIDGPLGSNTRYPPIRLQDGRLLLPAYDDFLQRALFFSSADGVRWALRSIAETRGDHHPIQPSIVELEDGRLLGVMRNTGRNWLWVTASDDLGRHWSWPADSRFPNPGSPSALLKLKNASLVLVYNDSPLWRRPLSIALSQDSGRTWPYRRILTDGEESYSYPSAVQSSDGLIHLVYSLARRRIRHVSLNEAWIIQGDPVGSR
ncbi:MAG: exo-alpha-sialidase [Phycisphaerae bacterium]